MENIMFYADSFLWGLAALATGYLLLFTIAAMRKRKYHYPEASQYHRIAVIFPAYREDRVIVGAVRSVQAQDYPQDRYTVVVVSDQMQESTNTQLEATGIRLLRANFEHSSKARALQFAMEHLSPGDYDMVVILDADNTVLPDFLRQVNNAFYSGATAIQAHRKAKNLNTDIAVLDAVSEEINNSIFRRGHVRLGLSAALSGSGMAFDFQWFHNHVRHLHTAGEDKELEAMLLKDRVYIDYLDDVPVFDEKTQKKKAYSNQRRRWLAAQYNSLTHTLGDLPKAIITGNWDYCDKLFQWLMPSRVLLLGFVGIITLALFYFKWVWSLKWWGLLFFLVLSFVLAIPDEIADDRFRKALRKTPLIFGMMLLNLFRLRGADKRFIHTPHGIEAHENSH